MTFRTLVNSSAIQSVGYDAATQTLELQYKKDKAIHRYEGVSPKTYLELMGASSIGRFVAQNIVKSSFTHTKVEEDDNKSAEQGSD
jgi:hypothetical protein